MKDNLFLYTKEIHRLYNRLCTGALTEKEMMRYYKLSEWLRVDNDISRKYREVNNNER